MSNQKTNKQEQEQVKESVPVQEAKVVETKQSVKGWIKAHRKGVAGTIAGIGAAAVSAVIAYRKGKEATMPTVPMESEDNDYSLDPNNS